MWLNQLCHPGSRLLNAIETRLLIKPPTRACSLTLVRNVALAHRAVRRDAAASTDSHPSIGLGEMMFVEPNGQLGWAS